MIFILAYRWSFDFSFTKLSFLMISSKSLDNLPVTSCFPYPDMAAAAFPKSTGFIPNLKSQLHFTARLHTWNRVIIDTVKITAPIFHVSISPKGFLIFLENPKKNCYLVVLSQQNQLFCFWINESVFPTFHLHVQYAMWHNISTCIMFIYSIYFILCAILSSAITRPVVYHRVYFTVTLFHSIYFY